MKYVLTGLKTFDIVHDKMAPLKAGYVRLTVECCAICRTDAKIWREGHRALSLPRVPGHEIASVDDKGNRYVVWPGSTCNSCRYCKSGRENLCEEMRITGFHEDGGFSSIVDVPADSLIPIPEGVAPELACFAEPLGCAIHSLKKTALQKKERILVLGGGTVGLLTALAARHMGARVIVLEHNEEKIHKITPFLNHTRIRCAKTIYDSEFDVVVNACDDPIAFSVALIKAAKGARVAFFSGLKKNHTIESNLLNLIHYKEHTLVGAYGCTQRDMAEALPLISHEREALALLTEAIISPEEIPATIKDVLSGMALKYIIQFSKDKKETRAMTSSLSDTPATASPAPVTGDITETSAIIREVLQRLTPVGDALLPAAQRKIDFKTKPLGALGKLEEVAVRMSLIQENLDPALGRKAMFVFAADHGIAEEGVSAFPAEVTAQMVQNFLNGGAAINVLCRHNDIDIRVVDMGVKCDMEPHPDLIHKKVRKGTRNFALEPAMTRSEAIQALENGMTVFLAEHEATPIDIVGLGEMGIANTTAATAIICAATGITAQEATGRGTGVDDAGLKHKTEVIHKALNFHKLEGMNGLDILMKVGGYEIAGITGAILAAASMRTAIVLDGVISTAAGLIAGLLCPDVKGYLFSGHKSVEISQKSALDTLGLSPLIDLDMRLGEGTGAALAIDLIDAATRIMREMASFEEAGVSNT